MSTQILAARRCDGAEVAPPHLRQYEPVPRTTATTVLSRIAMSPVSDQFWMYDTSTNSDCSCVRLLRPDTCHGPVMPGFTSNLVEYSVPYGVDFLNKDRSEYTFNSDKGVEYIQQYVDMYKEKGFPKDGLNANIITAENLYFQGHIAYMPDSTSSVAAFKQNAPDLYKQLDVAPLVTNTKNTLNPMLMAVNSQTKNKEMALKLANFLTNKENQIEFSKKSNTYPSAAGAMDDPFFTSIDDSTLEGKVLKVAKEEIDNGTVANFPPEVSDADGANYMSPNIIQAIQGDMSVKEALDKSVAAMNDRLHS